MKKIAMLVVESPSRVSKAIQVGTMRPANHAAVEFVDDELIFEALFRGIEVTKASQWYQMRSKKTTVHKATFEVDDELYKQALDTAWANEKQKYDFLDLFMFLPITRNLVKRFKKDGGGWICSEFAEHLFRIVKLHFVRINTKPSDVSPGDLFDSIRLDMGEYQEFIW